MSKIVPLRNPIANRLASLRPSERGEPNFVDGLLSDRSFGGGKAVLKRGLVVYVPLNPAPPVVAIGVFDDVGKMKALVLLTEASRQVMMRREIMIAVDVCSNIYLRSEYFHCRH